jgi:hypothetical protein
VFAVSVTTATPYLYGHTAYMKLSKVPEQKGKNLVNMYEGVVQYNQTGQVNDSPFIPYSY